MIKIHQRLEKKLLKNQSLDAFNQDFTKMLNNGSLVELTPQEIDMWGGPAHYVSLQAVEILN